MKIIFPLSKTGRADDPHADAHLEDDPIAREPGQLAVRPATVQGAVHRPAVQAVLHREARGRDQALPGGDLDRGGEHYGRRDDHAGAGHAQGGVSVGGFELIFWHW